VKLGLISDVHGDPVALELAWAHLTVLGAERIVCAGDVVGYGPRPDEVAAFLIEHQIPSVRGNHDRWALSRQLGERDEFGGGPVSAQTLEYLRTLDPHVVLEAGERIVVVVHGSPYSDMEYIQRQTHPPEVLRRLLRATRSDILVSGHTHEPMWYASEGKLVINPGSTVSMPVVRSSRTFAVVDTEELSVSFHDVESGQVVDLKPWMDDPDTASEAPSG
jgi:putative phosphoesterase